MEVTKVKGIIEPTGKVQGSKYSVTQRQEICNRIIEYVREGYSEEEACNMTKMPRSTISNWKRQDEKFNRELKSVRNEESLTLAQQNIRIMLESKNPKIRAAATMFVLKHYDEQATTRMNTNTTHLDINRATEALKKMHEPKKLEDLDRERILDESESVGKNIDTDQGI